MNVKVNKDKINRMIAMYKTGMTCVMIAEQMDLSEVTVQKYMREAGVMRHRTLRKDTEEKLENANGGPVKCSEVGSLCKFRAFLPYYKCDYLYYQGHMRGCDPECCTKFYEEMRTERRHG